MLRQNKQIIRYLIVFLGVFSLLFYGTEAVIGFSSPGNHYNAFVAQYLNFIDPFRIFLLSAAKVLLSLVGYQTYLKDEFTLNFFSGSGVRMVYSCIGYGILSFWIAFIIANNGSWKRKGAWIVGGCVFLCTINVIRISLLMIAIKKGWPVPFGWDHHTWFNIVAYSFIFGMIYLYDISGRQREVKFKDKSASATVRCKKELKGLIPDRL